MLDVLDLNSVANKWVNTDQVYLGGLMCVCGSDGIYLDACYLGFKSPLGWDSFSFLDDCEDWL